MNDIRGTLAKLLATENILVEHKKVPTASFDVQKRVLILPIWDRASNRVYSMLVGHEVGHALFTPSEFDPTKFPCPKSFVNVTEDARIEKMMKRKYPGLSKDFYIGYQELNEQDFFSIADEKLENLPLIDRINLHYKIGAFAMMPFNDSETPLRDAVGAAETFEEAVAAAVAIYEYMKAEKEKQQQECQQENNANEQGSVGNSDSSSGEMTHEEMLEEAERRESENDGGEESQGWGDKSDADLDTPSYDAGGGKTSDIDDVRTQENFDSSISELTDNSRFHDPLILDLPTIDLDRVVVPNGKILSGAEQFWSEFYAEVSEPYETVDRLFTEFCNRTSKDVNYLVKEFECRKAASASARASVSKTGVLDTSKLHTYKYNDDIFRKVMNVSNGKNHGLVFLLDWSGSMGDEIYETVCQVINLCQFCKKVGIPFDVYSFVCDPSAALMTDPELTEFTDKETPNQFYIDRRFRLMNLITSEGNQKSFQKQCKILFRIAEHWRKEEEYNWRIGTLAVPHFMGLGGTPLNEALIVMNELLPAWKAKKNVEKTHLIVLTDGESCNASYVASHENSTYMTKNYVNSVYACTIRNRKTGRYYSGIQNGHMDTTRTLIKILRDNHVGTSVIGFRICDTRSLNIYMARFMGVFDSDSYKNQWKKDKCIVLDNTPYTQLYVIRNNSYTEDTSMQVKEDATKAQIKKAFVTSLNSKAVNRRLLSSFVGQIA